MSDIAILPRSWRPWLADPAKPFQQRRVDLGRTLLLDPVAGAINNPDQPQIDDVLAHHLDKVDTGDEGKDGIELARDERGRLFDLALCDLRLLGKIEL